MPTTRRADVRRVAAVVGTALLLAVTAVCGYARYELADRDAFADRVTSSLDDRGVRTVIADRVVDGLAEQVVPEALVAAPLVRHGIAWVVGTPRFKRLFERAVGERHEALARGHRSVAFELFPGAGELLQDLRGLSPRLAAAIPRAAGVTLVTLRPRSFEARAARGVATASDWFVPLLVLSLVALVVCALLGGGIAGALENVGVAIAGAGLLVAGLETVVGAFVVSHGAHALDLDDGAERDALHAVFTALFGDLRTAGLLAALGGFVVAAAPAGGRWAGHLTTARRRLTSMARAQTPVARRLRGAILALLGVALVLDPVRVLRVVLVLVGVGALVLGLAELIGRRPSSAGAGAPRPGTALRLGGAVALVVAAVVVAMVFVLPAPSTPAPAPTVSGCNGSRALCGRALSEVVFPSTHNSYAAADERGWYLPNQRFGIERQLRDGIRGFLIDPHYGIRDDRSGLIRTPLRGEGSSRNKVAQELGPKALHLADRLAGRIGAQVPSGVRRTYLCHTLCELGAEPLEEQLWIFSTFLDTHRQAVLLLVVEPYISVADFERAMRRAGLLHYAASLRRDEPLPTLGDLVRSGHRLVVFAERDGGQRPWYLPAFDFIQDTPYRAGNARELSCGRYRGTPDSPLFLVNHWISTPPPSPRRNREIGGRVLRDRIARCERERQLVANLVAVDFYERSDVVQIARELNSRRAR